MLRFIRRLNPKRFQLYKREILLRNAKALNTYLGVGIAVAMINVLLQADIHKTTTFIQSIGQMVYLIAVYLILRYLIKKPQNHATLLLYIVQAPIIIISILMGTVWDSKTQMVTYLMLVILMPLFILDNPLRQSCITILYTVMACFLSYLVKDNALFKLDLIHLVGFTLASLLANLYILAERIDGVEDNVRSTFRAEHDISTGLKNRYALKKQEGTYLDSPLTVMLIDIDYFKFFNDMYGHNVGEEIFKVFAKAVSDVFKPENCFRYEEAAILVLLKNTSEQNVLHKLDQVKTEFQSIDVKGKHLHPSFSAGYVYGQVRYDIDFREMIRHADIRLLEATNRGAGQVAGHAYDNSRKRQTDILSEVGQNMNRGTLDELTGLPNMQYFRAKAEEMIANTVDRNKQTIFVYFNIGNFKSFNEEYGFKKGDELLQNIAKIIKEEFPDRLISRFSEDHFVVMTYMEDVENILNDIQAKVRPLFNKVNMTLKVGIYKQALGEDVGLSCDKAKIACDSIKKDFAKKFRYYDQELENKTKLHQYVISHIDEAVENNYLRVYYQPIIDVKTGKLAKVEALARWMDPVHGMLSPADFIPVLEDAHLIHKVDIFVAERVCQDYINVRGERNDALPVSINLSRLDFMLTDIVSAINGCVDAYKVPREKIHIEITESALAEDYQELLKRVDELKSLGFDVWLDDFGSGYSSFNALQDFDFDVIKVDMQFMHNFANNPQTPVILNSIMRMSDDLKMQSLVEGVETEEQFRFLQSIGTSYAQGYLFSKPIPLEELRRKYIDEFPGHARVQ
ncbi:MAG: bifunctional diguanylate cyclase/phosphodiesterase [Lachnospiraceae bacterium]|nr:bifunctional diguanylate cyclase/phosphodiesterase [Lachnospiraceae bacterium]